MSVRKQTCEDMRNLWVKLYRAHEQTHAVRYSVSMHHTHPLTPSPLSPPQLPYSWVGSALSCIIMAQILPLFWPLLAFLPASVCVKCHVSADSVFWASMSIIRHTTLWKPVDPLLKTHWYIFYVCGFVLCFYPLLCKHNFTSKSQFVFLNNRFYFEGSIRFCCIIFVI